MDLRTYRLIKSKRVRVVINRHLSKGVIIQYDWDTDDPWIQTDSWRTLYNAIDKTFLKSCGINPDIEPTGGVPDECSIK